MPASIHINSALYVTNLSDSISKEKISDIFG